MRKISILKNNTLGEGASIRIGNISIKDYEEKEINVVTKKYESMSVSKSKSTVFAKEIPVEDRKLIQEAHEIVDKVHPESDPNEQFDRKAAKKFIEKRSDHPLTKDERESLTRMIFQKNAKLVSNNNNTPGMKK